MFLFLFLDFASFVSFYLKLFAFVFIYYAMCKMWICLPVIIFGWQKLYLRWTFQLDFLSGHSENNGLCEVMEPFENILMEFSCLRCYQPHDVFRIVLIGKCWTLHWANFPDEPAEIHTVIGPVSILPHNILQSENWRSQAECCQMQPLMRYSDSSGCRLLKYKSWQERFAIHAV